MDIMLKIPLENEMKTTSMKMTMTMYCIMCCEQSEYHYRTHSSNIPHSNTNNVNEESKLSNCMQYCGMRIQQYIYRVFIYINI